MKFRSLTSILTVLACFGGLGMPAASADDTNGKGQALFVSENCYLCHDRAGQGGVGPTISGKHAPPLTGFIAFVRNPGQSSMPPYTTEVISDADLTAIWNYLSAIPAPPSALPEPLKRLAQ